MKTEIKWGLMLTVMALLWMLLERAIGLHDKHINLHPILTNLILIPTVLMMVLAIKEKKRLLGGRITFTQAFLCGLSVSVVVALLALPAQWLTHYAITPRYFENAITYAVLSGKATPEQARGYFNLKSYMLQASIGGLAGGAIISLIIAAFVRTKNS